MPKKSRTGHLQFAVEVMLPSEQTSLAVHREVLATCQQLDVMFGGHGIRPTWAVAPALHDAVRDIVQDGGDFALLLQTEACLHEYLRAAKQMPARAVHTAIVSRVQPDLLQVAELSALGIRAMNLPMGSDNRSQRVHTRHGLSMVRTTGTFPGPGRFLGRWDLAFQTKGLVHRALLRQSTEAINLQLDALPQPTRSLRSLQKSLSIVQRLRSSGRLNCETLLETHARLCPSQKGSTTQQSVLRAA